MLKEKPSVYVHQIKDQILKLDNSLKRIKKNVQNVYKRNKKIKFWVLNKTKVKIQWKRKKQE